MMGSSVGVGRVADERQRLPAGGAACHNNADGTVSGGAGVRGGGRRKSRPSGRTPFSSGNSPSVIVVAAGAPLTFQTRYRGAACSVLRNNTKKGNLPLGPTLPDQYNLIRQLAVAYLLPVASPTPMRGSRSRHRFSANSRTFSCETLCKCTRRASYSPAP